MERREASYITSAGLTIQALFWPGYMLLTLPRLMQSTMSVSRFILGLILLVGIPCTAIPLWIAWGVWTRRKYNFLLGLWTVWTLYYGIGVSLMVFISILNGYVPPLQTAFIHTLLALTHIPTACISVIYIFTTPPVPEDQWW